MSKKTRRKYTCPLMDFFGGIFMRGFYLGKQQFNSNNIDKLFQYLESYIDNGYKIKSITLKSRKTEYNINTLEELKYTFKEINFAKYFKIIFEKKERQITIYNAKFRSKEWYIHTEIEKDYHELEEDNVKIYLSNKELELFKPGNYETFRMGYFTERWVFFLIIISIIGIVVGTVYIKLAAIACLLIMALTSLFIYKLGFYKS